MMDKVFKQVIGLQIAGLHENRFQEFVERLYTIIYGTSFTPILQKHDKGCDGLLCEKKTVISVYAPLTYALAGFKKKASDDFEKYKLHWAQQYPNWQFIYNGTPTAEGMVFLKKLKADVEPVTAAHLLERVELLTWSEKRRIARHLGVDEQLLVYNVLDTILDDLLKRADNHDELPPWQSPLYIGDKIALNYCPEDIVTATAQHTEGS